MPTRRTAHNGGCWTCKLRRKKCDEAIPVCHDCGSLKIDCHYGSKPTWMDGGVRQKQKAMSLKEEIKRSISRRRENAHVHREAFVDIGNQHYNVISDMTISHDLSEPQRTAATESEIEVIESGIRQKKPDKPTLLATLPWSHQQHQRSDTLEQASPSEWNFIMKYLDFVFPALFPFYQPHIFDTGRSWLLLLLRKSKIAYHAALGLSCYYFTMALSDAENVGEHAVCRQLRWNEVEKETERCFDSLRAEIMAVNLGSGCAPIALQDKIELMNSITQVIVFEMTMGKAAPWNSHLPAAISLFEEIITHSNVGSVYRGQPQSKLASVLLEMGEPLWTNPWPSNHIWAPAQAGLQFYAGVLVFVDIIASTATGQVPRLLSYHHDVLSVNDDGISVVGEAEIRLSNIAGCPNWVARSITKVSALVSRTRTRSGLDVAPSSEAEISDHCANISQEINDGIAVLKTSLTASAASCPDYNKSCDSTPLALGLKPSVSSISALVWALATQLYFLAALGRHSRDDLCVQAAVTHLLDLLKHIPSNRLRNVAWPIFIAGCLTLDAHQSSFRALLSGLARTDKVGALDDAHQMLEQEWMLRSKRSGREVDITSCFAVLGSPVLLF